MAAQDNAYALFLSCRVGQAGWRGFVIPNARRVNDLFGGEEVRWSTDVFVDAGLTFHEEQVGEAQRALVRLLASRLGIEEKEIVPARNGRAIKQDDRPRLSGAQIHQTAQTQPRRR